MKKRCKRPLTSNGFKDATSDPVQIETWWRQFPNAMIGVPTGSRIGFWAMDPDLDDDKGQNGPADLARLEAEHGRLPRTPTSVTLRSGRHLLFKWNPARPVTIGPGSLPSSIHVRGDGGYIIVAPSKREDGASYRWEVPPEECEFAEAPEWLYRLIKTRKKRKAEKGDLTPPRQQPEVGGGARERTYAQAVLANAAREVASAAPGARNEILNRYAFNLGRMVGEGQLDRGDVEQRLLGAAGQCGLIDDDGEQAAKATIRSGLDAGIEAANEFDLDAKGRVVLSPRNIALALRKLGVSISCDVFQGRAEIQGLEGFGPALDDAAIARLWLTAEERFELRTQKDRFWTVVEDAARGSAFHPVRDYLDSLKWDGVPRIDTWLSAYGGAEDTPYTRAVSALTLIAAVRRVRKPGAKFDEMPVLESEQGKEKSSALEVLAVRDEWFSADLPFGLETQKVIERLRGRWIVEAAEMAGMRKSEVEQIKSFLSRRVDRARMAYRRLPTEFPRQCVIIGTTNSDRYLRDSTGNRRFWPVKVEKFDLEALKRDRDQLWAEAAAREALGESIRMDPGLWEAAAAEQEARRLEDPWEERLRHILGEMDGKIRTEDVWRIVGVPVDRRAQEHNARLGSAMRKLGWERNKRRFGERDPEWAYVRAEVGSPERRILVQMEGEKPVAYYEGEEPPF